MALIADCFYGTKDPEKFTQGFRTVLEGVDPAGVFLSDNLFTFGKNLGFLENQKLTAAVARNAGTVNEKGIIWRTHILAWAIDLAIRRKGDFVECGTYKGMTARILCDYCNIASTDRRFYIYDLFEGAMEAHGPGLFDQVKSRFADLPAVSVIKGKLPDALVVSSPERISFLHIDLNNAEAEIGCLEALFDRVADGAPIILDDYGWSAYAPQKAAADVFFTERGITVAELPTGQGLVIK